MDGMFFKASAFNQPLDNWDVSNVENMFAMFYEARQFNQDLNSWDLARVVVLVAMFSGASSFDQCLSSWASSTANKNDMFEDAGCSGTNAPNCCAI